MEVAAQISAEDKAFEFSPGLFGFPESKRYIVTDIPGGGDIIKQMISLDESNLSFTLAYPYAFFSDYAPDIPDADLQDLGAERPDQILVMVLVSVPEQFKDATVNLKAPIAFNPFTRKARQIILAEDRYSTRQRLFSAQ